MVAGLEQADLQPADRRSCITRDELLEALRLAKENAIEFLHIGACESVTDGDRRRSLSALADASGRRWVSGYVSEVDWLLPMLLDLAIVGELYLPFYPTGTVVARSSSEGPGIFSAPTSSSRMAWV